MEDGGRIGRDIPSSRSLSIVAAKPVPAPENTFAFCSQVYLFVKNGDAGALVYENPGCAFSPCCRTILTAL
jgi:hypothetical protein